MSSFDGYVRRVFFGTLSLVLVFTGIFLLAARIPWARGVALGGIASLANLVVMAGDVKRHGGTAAGQLVRPAHGRYAIRMTVTAAALVYAAVSTRIALWAVIPALFAPQFVMACGELAGKRERESI